MELVNPDTLLSLRSGAREICSIGTDPCCVRNICPTPEGDLRVNLAGDVHLFSITRIPNERCWKANVALGADWQLDRSAHRRHYAWHTGLCSSGSDCFWPGFEFWCPCLMDTSCSR